MVRDHSKSDVAIRKLIDSEKAFLTERLSQKLSPKDREVFSRQLKGYEEMEIRLGRDEASRKSGRP